MNTTAPNVVRRHRRILRLWEWTHDNGLTLGWVAAIGWVVVALCR